MVLDGVGEAGLGVPRGAGAPAAAVGDGGGGGLVALDGGKRFGEHRWRPRKLGTGSFGREEGWRRGLRGGLEGGGAHGGGGGRFQQRGRAEHDARAQEWKERRVRTPGSSREGSRRVKGEGRARCGRPERHDVAVALRRPFSTCAPGMAPRGEAEMLQENQGRGESRGSARGRRRDGDAVTVENRARRWS